MNRNLKLHIVWVFKHIQYGKHEEKHNLYVYSWIVVGNLGVSLNVR